ncbi:pantoate--beta-alanine ligase [Isosphaera pallida]|uniref:pantoate--beta-alanine ligase n=1 Tax=Isosphaera pallida TaxID=128 RepID=UPI0009D7448D|nr:pantoate--beta-alanine ligase [Isosphaera pallida]
MVAPDPLVNAAASGLKAVVVATPSDVRKHLVPARAAGKRIGLVPTMGALHAGHASLITSCRKDCDVLVVSIFVNPTQFGPNEDLDRYPRTFAEDCRLCDELGVDLIYAPTTPAMYPPGFATTVRVEGLSSVWEGASRPTHFQGVATVVLKLFQQICPDVAWFGLKDFQQTVILSRMVTDLDLGVELKFGPTIREPDGLALSSRNRLLSPEDRAAAPVLYRALKRAAEAVSQGEEEVDRVRQILWDTLNSEPRGRVDYAEILDPVELTRLEGRFQGRPAVAALAVRFGEVRLIDNHPLTPASPRSREPRDPITAQFMGDDEHFRAGEG